MWIIPVVHSVVTILPNICMQWILLLGTCDRITLRKSNATHHCPGGRQTNVIETFSEEVQAVAVTLDAFALSDVSLLFSTGSLLGKA